MKSIGKILKSARQKKNYTIIDIQEHIKVHPKYIRAMEADDYSVFEGRVHSKGFLKIYIKFLDLDENEILALWRRDYEPSFDTSQNQKLPLYKSLEPERFVITPRLLAATVLAFLLVGFFMYLFIQYRQYTDAPSLDIFYPDDNIVMQEDVLDISGKIELDSSVFVNNQKIIANPDGSFVLSLKLREGINTISIKAVNKLNKETEVIRTIIYRPEKVDEFVEIPASEEISKDGSLDNSLEVTQSGDTAGEEENQIDATKSLEL